MFWQKPRLQAFTMKIAIFYGTALTIVISFCFFIRVIRIFLRKSLARLCREEKRRNFFRERGNDFLKICHNDVGQHHKHIMSRYK